MSTYEIEERARAEAKVRAEEKLEERTKRIQKTYIAIDGVTGYTKKLVGYGVYERVREKVGTALNFSYWRMQRIMNEKIGNVHLRSAMEEEMFSRISEMIF